MKNLLLITVLSAFMIGCNMSPNKEERIQKLEAEIQNATKKIQTLESRIEVLESK